MTTYPCEPSYKAYFMDQIGAEALWVVHAFQKKSKSGIKTPKQDINLIEQRIKILKAELKKQRRRATKGKN